MEYPENLKISELELPVYLMNVPTGFHATSPDNAYMDSLSFEERIVNKERAIYQWLNLYNYLASAGIVYLLPTPKENLQDLVFASNIGVTLNHIPGREIFIASDFMVKERFGETKWGEQIMGAMGFEVYKAPFKFEGDAELKHVRDNIYVGAYGIRSNIEVYDWMEEQFDMKIIRVKPNNPQLYHLDVNFLPITGEDAFCCLESFTPKEVKSLEGITNLHPIPTFMSQLGGTSGVRFYNTMCMGSCIKEVEGDDYWFDLESQKKTYLEKICSKVGVDLVFFNLSEFYKGGGDLSCLCVQVNRKSFEIKTK